MDYQFREIEDKWQQFWAANQTFKTISKSDKPKYYVLDMFPYPSGAGLHVGHPLGYIASDIFSRYKRLKGFNVLHPMGYDSFGLPAEQYAIQTGQHPSITTEENIATYRKQLDRLGFSFDWSREVRTSDPAYYKWTQWIFMQLFNSWYNKDNDQAENISMLIAHFEKSGSKDIHAVSDDDVSAFTSSEWTSFTEKQQEAELLKYRLTYLRESTVNWCPKLGTVLANDEVKDGFSERGGFPVEQKKMMQWSMRITAYADRLLRGIDTIDWPEPVKEMQRNWIGKSIGASVKFTIYDFGLTNDEIVNRQSSFQNYIEVFTTRVDTIYGVSFLVLAPEHELVDVLTTEDQKEKVQAYILQTSKKTELDRMADTKTVSGVFTGSYAINPVDGEKVQIWIADYVLAGYGTGAVMGVPSGDQRDWLFATKFGLPILQINDAQQQLDEQADPTKEGRYINSGMINGMDYTSAIATLNSWLEENGSGKAKINYRMRDAIFGRQRYWGEPIPVYYKDGVPHLLDEKDLPLILPEIDKYLPTETGEPPLGRATDWLPSNGEAYELSTMPGWAGSSWYWYRYMDARNPDAFASKQAIEYWKDVDLYIGGSEHATGHLLYSRFWNKFLKDIGCVKEEEPFKKLINQGMIQGRSNFVYKFGRYGTSANNEDDRHSILKNIFISYPIVENFEKLFKKHSKIQSIDFHKQGLTSFGDSDLKYSDQENAFLSKFNISLFKFLENSSTSSVIIYPNTFISLHVDVNIVENEILDLEKFKLWRPENEHAEFIFGDGTISSPTGGGREGAKYICGVEVEKMSKSKFNVVNPDDLIERYGADTLRMYEMFLGPLEQSKPWNTNGIEGVFKFLRKFWRLFHNTDWEFTVTDEAPTKAELKSLHKIIKKVQDDVERFSFNTSVSSFMIAVNELTDLKCNKRAILSELIILLSPYAPHICEELWVLTGHEAGTLSYTSFPVFNAEYLAEDSFSYPVSVNGKTRLNLNMSLAMAPTEMEAFVLADEHVQKYLEGKKPKKVIIVKGRIVNIVL